MANFHILKNMKTPSLKTKRLLIRPIKVSDAEDYFEFASLPNIGPQAGWEPHRSVNESKMVINNMNYFKPMNEPRNFAIVYLENDKMIGTIELYHFNIGGISYQAELGYSINPVYQNQGIATEACEAVLKYGFEDLKLIRVEASAFPTNLASMRVCEKVGMQKEGILRKSYLSYDNKIYDRVVYSMTIDDYNRKKSQNEI